MRKSLEIMRAHPIITSVTVVSCIVGTIVGGLLLPPEWPLVRRLAAGMLSGAGCALLVVAPRVVGQ